MANESRLVLPKPMLAKLNSLGIYCQTWVTAERQERAKRWVLRGVESGGSAREFGRYISFFAPTGSRLEWLQKADRIGANGVHAVVIGEVLVGIEVARVEETYQMVIARYELGKPKVDGKRPAGALGGPAADQPGQPPRALVVPQVCKRGECPGLLARRACSQPGLEQIPGKGAQALRRAQRAQGIQAGVARFQRREGKHVADRIEDCLR